jgi:3-hydroxyisobutyrate dehydrogenase-like beta-hydroxyacid dehydrogenase
MKIGFIGLGRMGGAMATNLAKAGHDLAVYDVLPEARAALAAKGMTAAPTARAVAEASEAVFLSVPGPDEVDEAIGGRDGILAGARRGLLLTNTSTITPQQSRTLAAACEAAGVDFLDAPVSGAVHGAVAGTLTVMVGGTAAAFERAQPLLDRLGSKVRHVGAVGSASALKLVNQAVYVSYLTTFAEGLALGEQFGLSVEVMLDVLGTSAAGHPMIAAKYDEIRGTAKTPGFAIERALLFLDLTEATKSGAERRTPVFDAVAASLRHARSLGLAGEDVIVARNRYLEP